MLLRIPNQIAIYVLVLLFASPFQGAETTKKIPYLATFEIKGKRPPCEIQDVEFSPKGKLLAVATENPFVTLISTDKLSVQGTIGACKGEVTSLAFSPDGQFIFLASRNVSKWNLDNKRLQSTIRGSGPIAVARNGKILAVGRRLVDSKTEKTIKSIDPQTGAGPMDSFYDPATATN